LLITINPFSGIFSSPSTVYLSPQKIRKQASVQLIQIFITAIRYFSGRKNISDNKAAHNIAKGRKNNQNKAERIANQNL
jgi:hypothetical protein